MVGRRSASRRGIGLPPITARSVLPSMNSIAMKTTTSDSSMLELLILGPVDETHAAFADAVEDAEVRELPADHLRNQGSTVKP